MKIELKRLYDEFGAVAVEIARDKLSDRDKDMIYYRFECEYTYNKCIELDARKFGNQKKGNNPKKGSPISYSRARQRGEIALIRLLDKIKIVT